MDSTEEQNNDNSVTLLVKAPDQHIDDQTVECKLDWSVAMLKDHLAQVYPGKPRHTDQKIIFSGQLLSDSMILKDVLQQYYNKEDRSFIVHLVCGGQWKASSTAKTKTKIGLSDTGNAMNVQSASTATTAPPPQPTPVEQYYSQLNNQQMAWMQQAYAHYLTQYTQFMAAQGIQLQSTSPYTRPLNAAAARASDAANNNNAVTNNNNAEGNEDNEDRAARDARVAGAPGVAAAAAGDANAVNNNNNNNNNNVNAPADEALGGGAALNRDWLDIIDMLSRIVVLSSIVYFYSSPSRFLIVTFLGFAIYLIQGGFFRGQPVFLAENNNARVENNNQVAQNEPVDRAPPAPTPNPPQPAPRNPTTVPAGGNDEAARTNVNEENERPGAWAFTWTFFSSFFASLIPDQPNVI